MPGFRAAVWAALALCLEAPRLLGQTPQIPPPTRSQVTFHVTTGAGPLTGQVMAPSGRPVVSALVWLDGDTTTQTRADELGRFRLQAPSPGSHTLEVRFTGFGSVRSPFRILPTTQMFADILLVPLPLDGPGSGFEIEVSPYPDTLRSIPKAVDSRPQE